MDGYADHALVTSTSSGILVNSGHLLENLVYTTLRGTTPEIFYFNTKSGREVDFVFHGQDRSRGLVQVCESLVDPHTRKREITALSGLSSSASRSKFTVTRPLSGSCIISWITLGRASLTAADESSDHAVEKR